MSSSLLEGHDGDCLRNPKGSPIWNLRHVQLGFLLIQTITFYYIEGKTVISWVTLLGVSVAFCALLVS